MPGNRDSRASVLTCIPAADAGTTAGYRQGRKPKRAASSVGRMENGTAGSQEPNPMKANEKLTFASGFVAVMRQKPDE